MAYTKKALEDLNVMDDFLMNRLASDVEVGEEFCRVMLSTLLQRKIGKVNVTVQKVMPPADPNLKGIRMDVKVEEFLEQEQTGDLREGMAMNIYDIEPHLVEGTDLPRHNRFYQALSDSSNLKSGETDYRRLPDMYILMILDKDPFGYDYMMYSIRNKCEEIKEMDYEDGLRFYYFYTGGSKGGNDKIKTMLRYIRDSRKENATDFATREIHRFAERVKVRPEVRKSYMLWEEYEYLWKKKLKSEVEEEIRNEVEEEIRNEVEGEIRNEIEGEIRNGIIELLEDYGKVPENLKERVNSVRDMEILKCWFKLAAKISSVEEFERMM